MKKIKLDKQDFEMVMGYYWVQRDYGQMKYLFEVSASDREADKLCRWLKLAEKTGLEFSVWMIKKCDNCKLFYGFSDFCISENLDLKVFYFNFESERALQNKFCEWNDESEACYLPDELVEYLESVKRVAENADAL